MTSFSTCETAATPLSQQAPGVVLTPYIGHPLLGFPNLPLVLSQPLTPEFSFSPLSPFFFLGSSVMSHHGLTSTSIRHGQTLGEECGDREAEKTGQKGFS